MNGASFHAAVLLAFVGLALFTMPFLLFVSAPYGRHARPGWGPSLPSAVGWVAMELPALVLVTVLILSGPHGSELVPLVFLAMWCLHHAHRTFVFPLRRHKGARPMPISIAGSAFFFNPRFPT